MLYTHHVRIHIVNMIKKDKTNGDLYLTTPVYMLRRPFNILFLVCVFLSPAHARPMYTDLSNSTFPLVLCGSLHDAVLALKEREVLEHVIGADWLELNCVSIDPCTQKSSNEDSIFAMPLVALAGVLLSGNSSALRLPLSAAGILAAEHGHRAENIGSVEFARVPEGLRLQACAPDFDLFRRQGRLACNDDTIVVINANNNTRACPGTLPYSLLDCVKTVQFDASVETLVLRPATQKMHFGQATWEEACATELVLPDIVRAICSSLAQYTVSVPKPADFGSTSLLMYDFLEGYGCYRTSDLVEQWQVLSRSAAPNRIVTCAQVANGTQQRSDPYTCATVCDPGFVLETTESGDSCVSVCHGMLSSCPIGYFATNECQQGSSSFYNCSLCDAHPGFGAQLAVKGIDDVFACHYIACPPGTRSTGLACEACAVNTFSNTSLTLVCSDCNTVVTGRYQQLTGQTSCSTCMWNTEASAQECLEGTSFINEFQRLQYLFSLYTEDHNAQLQDYVAKICRMGFACLPCEPGHMEHDRACVKCPHGSYQHNFGAQECYKCASGQNTTSLGSTHSSHCVCDPGFE